MLNIVPRDIATDRVASAPLMGGRLVRMTYVDNSGMHNEKQEPFVVVGGVLIDADRCLIAVEDYLQELVVKHIPEPDRKGFVWHAMELWSGGRYFKRDDTRWPLEKRLEMLADLAAIPDKFDIQICFGWFDRANAPAYRFPPNITKKQKELVYFGDTFTRFCEQVEACMRALWPDEITIIVAEDQSDVRSLIREAHALYRDPDHIKAVNPKLTYFPFKHIRDTVHWAKKSESAHLQLADLCTFIIKKRLMEDDRIRPFYAAIKPQMKALKVGEDEAAESW